MAYLGRKWIWVYGIKNESHPDYYYQGRTESRWLSQQHPYSDAEMGSELAAMTRPMTTLLGNTAPLYDHVWWTAYNEATRSFGPWTKV